MVLDLLSYKKRSSQALLASFVVSKGEEKVKFSRLIAASLRMMKQNCYTFFSAKTNNDRDCVIFLF